MRLLRLPDLIAALILGFVLVTSAALPAAHAGICKVLARKVFGSSHHHKKRVVYRHRSVHRTTVNRTAPGTAANKNVATSKKGPSGHQPEDRSAQQYPSFFQWKTKLPWDSANTATPVLKQPDILPSSAPMLSKMAHSGSPTGSQSVSEPKESNDHAFSTRASWYGPGFAGRRTASGARFNQYGLTAASRTLPLGSKVLVANPTTGKCCTVTINDRGPYVGGRDIDLSRGAAARIGVTGVSPVVCVAYANPKEAGTSAAPTSSKSQSSSSRQHISRNRTRTRSSTARPPAKLNGKVMHLIADVLPL